MNQRKAEDQEIFNDDEDRGKGDGDVFGQMRETRTGFGAKVNKKDYSPGQHAAEGGLQPDDDEDDEDLGDEDEDEEGGEEGIDVEDDDDEGSDHNF